MNRILIFITVITLYSCRNDSKKQSDFNNAENSNVKALETTKTIDRLIGQWGIYEKIVKGTKTVCNVCPRIDFNESESATLTLASGETESYKFSVTADILKLDFLGDKNTDHYLTSSKYKMTFDQQQKYTELTLSLSDTEQYILRK